MRSVGQALLPLLLLALVPSPAEPQDSTRSRPSVELPAVQVIGRPHALARIPGSGQIVDALTLAGSHPRDLNEALRKVPGLFARDEEGFGLRPNLGIRGLNPTPSTKVLLLEDGIPFTIAPYGDNASYYHPPLDRFERIEVLKGSGQILFGPQTIGGVINYITPAMPATLGGTATFSLGTRGFLDGHASAGGMLGRVGVLFDYGHKAGRGARENIGSRLDDVSAKALLQLGANQTLTWRANYYRERSRVTYSGLTEAEYAAAPRQNPFRNDSMRLDRWGVSATHQVAAGQTAELTTTLYGYRVARDWWRQSSNSTQRPNDASDPAPRPGLAFEATLFRMDFDNQVIAASLAGGSGAALTSAGRTRHAGFEVAARLGGGIVGPGLQNFYVRTAYTWLGVARFEGDRFVYFGTSGNDVVGKVYAGSDAGDTRERLRVTGNRLPYAPEHLLTATLGYAHPGGVDFQLEAVSVSRAFGDAANTTVLAPDGQQGPIPGSTVWNGAVTVDIRPLRNSVFLSVKNLFDHSYIVDRSRGILPGNPRTLLVGLTYRIGR